MKVLALLGVGGAVGILVTAGAILAGTGKPAAVKAAPAQHVTIEIAGGVKERVTGPDFAVRPNVPVTLTILNSSPGAHTFTVQDIGLSRIIPAGKPDMPSRTVITFTMPKAGIFNWYCATPCNGDMGGRIYAILGRPAMHGVHWTQAA